MNYGALTATELVDRAKADPRFNVDPLFTALTARIEWVARPFGEIPPAHYNQTEVPGVRPKSNT